MQFGKRVFCMVWAFVFLWLSTCPAATDLRPEGRNARILWAFGAIRSSSNTAKAEAVRTKMVLHSGDKLKMMIQLQRKCYVYVIHKDTQGNLTMLFPYSIKQFDIDYQTDRKYFAPKDGWFQLDTSTGTETFYLMASDQRRLDIEYTYQQYASCKAADKQAFAMRMLSELDRAAEGQPALANQGEVIAQNQFITRGFERATGADPLDISQLAREISFDSSYSEIFVIEHR